MKAINLLTRKDQKELTPEEEAQLSHELAAAYHRDEASACSRTVQRIAEKVRACIDKDSEEPVETRLSEVGASTRQVAG
jgi:hypothetical protein